MPVAMLGKCGVKPVCSCLSPFIVLPRCLLCFLVAMDTQCKIMKNVLLDAVAGFFRLKIHRNHVNPNNLYNQVRSKLLSWKISLS